MYIHTFMWKCNHNLKNMIVVEYELFPTILDLMKTELLNYCVEIFTYTYLYL